MQEFSDPSKQPGRTHGSDGKPLDGAIPEMRIPIEPRKVFKWALGEAAAVSADDSVMWSEFGRVVDLVSEYTRAAFPNMEFDVERTGIFEVTRNISFGVDLKSGDLICQSTTCEQVVDGYAVVSVAQWAHDLAATTAPRVPERPETFVNSVSLLHILRPDEGWRNLPQVSPAAVPELIGHFKDAVMERGRRANGSDGSRGSSASDIIYSYLLARIDQAVSTEVIRRAKLDSEVGMLIDLSDYVRTSRIVHIVPPASSSHSETHYIQVEADVPAGFDRNGMPVRKASDGSGKLGARRGGADGDSPIEMKKEGFAFMLSFSLLRTVVITPHNVDLAQSLDGPV